AYAGHFVGQRNGCLVVTDPFFESNDPTLETVQRLAGSGEGLGPRQYRPGAVDDQHSQVFVTTFGNSAKPAPVTAGAFQRGDAKPGGKVPPRLEVMGRSSTRHQGSAGQQADAGHLPDQGDISVAPGQGGDLTLGEFRLVLEIVDFSEQLGEDHSESRWKVILVKDSDRVAFDGCGPGWNCMAKLSEAAAESVDASRSSGFPLFA